MPSTTNNSPTPPPLDEAAMLAWIEGRLSKIEESNLAKQARPGTTERIQQMQANRRALQSVRDERAPAELMDRVLAALEHDALVGLSNGQELSDHPPISIAPALKEKQAPSWTTRHAPALALAAGIALLLTGVAYWGSLLFKTGKTQQVAQNTPTNSLPAAPGVANKELAKGDTRGKTEGENADAAREIAAADLPQPAPTMTPGRMLALAREGRLVMRVQSRDLANLPEIAAIEHSKMDRSWRLTSNVPEQVVAAITPKPATFVGPVPERPMTIAGKNDRAATPTLGAPSAKSAIEPEDPAARVKAKFLVDLPNTEKALNQIKLVFADRLKAGVVFEELDEAVKLTPAQDPETLLWWTLPPAQWVEHVTVPVVVEGK